MGKRQNIGAFVLVALPLGTNSRARMEFIKF